MDDYRMNPPVIVSEITDGHTHGVKYLHAEPFSESTGTYGYTQPSVHCCPVCDGNGLVPAGFYNQTSGEWSGGNLIPEQCRSCDGKGYIIVR